MSQDSLYHCIRNCQRSLQTETAKDCRLRHESRTLHPAVPNSRYHHHAWLQARLSSSHSWSINPHRCYEWKHLSTDNVSGRQNLQAAIVNAVIFSSWQFPKLFADISFNKSDATNKRIDSIFCSASEPLLLFIQGRFCKQNQPGDMEMLATPLHYEYYKLIFGLPWIHWLRGGEEPLPRCLEGSTHWKTEYIFLRKVKSYPVSLFLISQEKQ